MASTIATARKNLQNKFGQAFASKATNAYCLAYLHQRPPIAEPVTFGAAEGMNVNFAETFTPISSENTILEFAEKKKVSTASKKGQHAYSHDLTRSAAEVLEKIPEKVNRVFKEFERIKLIQDEKNESIQAVQNLNTALQKTIEKSYLRKLFSLDDQPFLTEYCWLNHTLRVLPNPEYLSEIASDSDIQKIDLPRKLSKEINITGPTIFAPQFIKEFKNGGKGISIAIIDSEADIMQGAFKDRIFKKNNYTKEPWGNPDLHGTAVAGIIGSNDQTFQGIAPEAKLFNYKVLATVKELNSDDFAGAQAIAQALEDGMQIANCSWGAGPVKKELSREARACNRAWRLGLTIVKSAGNKGPGKKTLTTPADAEGIIVVGATDKHGKLLQDYSSRGPLPSGKNRPHLLAPGGAEGDEISSCLVNGGFGSVGIGTSFATPHVSGILALILEQHPTFSNEELKNFILKLCTKIKGTLGAYQGEGAVSLASLLKK